LNTRSHSAEWDVQELGRRADPGDVGQPDDRRQGRLDLRDGRLHRVLVRDVGADTDGGYRVLVGYLVGCEFGGALVDVKDRYGPPVTGQPVGGGPADASG
jgi:hypothetical protein